MTEEKGSILIPTSDDIPFLIIEPALDATQVINTFIMWSLLFVIFIPAAIYDWQVTEAATQQCIQDYGSDWKAFSVWSATGRNSLETMFSNERTCYNPTQCGYIPVFSPNQEFPREHGGQYYLNYVYDANADTSMNPFAGQVMTAIPTDGAKWFYNLTNNFTEIINQTVLDQGWYAEALPMKTFNGGQDGIEVSLMWDVMRMYCTDFINCPDNMAPECIAFLQRNDQPQEPGQGYPPPYY